MWGLRCVGTNESLSWWGLGWAEGHLGRVPRATATALRAGQQEGPGQRPAPRPCDPSHLCCHLGDEPWGNGPTEHILPQAGVPGVLQIADAAAHTVPVLHVRTLEFLVDMCLGQGPFCHPWWEWEPAPGVRGHLCGLCLMGFCLEPWDHPGIRDGNSLQEEARLQQALWYQGLQEEAGCFV